MNRRQFSQYVRLALVVALMLALFGAFSAFAQGSDLNLRTSKIGKRSISLRWNSVGTNTLYVISYKREGSSGYSRAGDTFGTSFTLSGLLRGATYKIEVDGGFYKDTITASTAKTSDGPKHYTPPPETCPHLPDHVTITGYHSTTQCQIVGLDGVGQMEVIKRGVIGAVDIWNHVSSLIEVCIRGNGWLVLLDTAYAPRMVMELAHFHRSDMTCGIIDRVGIVALLATAPPPDTPVIKLPTEPQPQPEDHQATQPQTVTLPTFEAIPLPDCQIKLVQTLYLRETPGGEIIGLVWLNSEVPAFEINGYWYKVEFEGQTGYISRYHREVLWGGCG